MEAKQNVAENTSVFVSEEENLHSKNPDACLNEKPEHSHMPLDDTISENVPDKDQSMTEKFALSAVPTVVPDILAITMSNLPEEQPESIPCLLNLLAENQQLTTLQYNSVIRYLSKERDEQIKLELGENAPQHVCVCGGNQNMQFDNTIVTGQEKLIREDVNHPKKDITFSDVPIIMASNYQERHPKFIQVLLNFLVSHHKLTILQYNTLIRYLSKQRDVQRKLKLGECAPQPQCVCGGRPVNVADLTTLVLRLIFSFLSAKDLLNVQMVCKPWRAITMDALMWKHAPVYIGGYKSLKFIPHVPYVHTVIGAWADGSELFEALLNNARDLRRMECSVYNISEDCVQNFLRKFHNIEFIRIRNDSGFNKTLHILSTCPNLKGIDFFIHKDGNEENFLQMCNTIGNGFPTLKELHISHICRDDNDNALSDMLRKKISQLTCLSLSYYDVDCEVLELILKSVKLQKLVMEDLPEVSLNLSSMTNLRSLALRFNRDISHSKRRKKFYTNLDEKLVFPQNVEHFKLYFSDDNCSKFNKGIISNIISSLPLLKSLDAGGITDHDINHQLQEISSLKNLHTVDFYSCPYLTAKGVEHITKCANLRQLGISKVVLKDSTYECLKNCTYLVDLHFRSCILNPDALLPTFLSMKYLSNVSVYYCKDSSKRKVIEDGIVKLIMQECTKKKHYVKIRSSFGKCVT